MPLGVAGYTIFLFLLAGTTDYWQAWVFIAMTTARIAAAVLLIPDVGGVMRERLLPGAGTKWWDKVFYAFYAPAFFSEVILAPLDYGRFHWTGELPLPLYAAAFAALALAFAIGTWAVRTNKFFSSVVRIQKDRGHTVIQEGPYAYVRHPGYVGGILMALSIPLCLGSVWALAPSAIVLTVLVIRTYLEDATLQKELKGYKAYTRKVRYRLVPGVW
jgi:protein-S-isoprenylcysteine O-methyltransferase Ste14